MEVRGYMVPFHYIIRQDEPPKSALCQETYSTMLSFQ
jgi:hypothetical protein